MSEIKGQLLGLMLVVGLFGAIAAAAYAIFNSTVTSVANSVEEVSGIQPTITPITYNS